MREGRKPRRPSHATVVAYLALFVALGGGAVAASQVGKNSVGAAQLKKGSVTSAKIRKGAVTGKKVAAKTLTGANIDVSRLGTVPRATAAVDAARLGGAAASSYAKADLEPVHVIGAAGQPRFEHGCRNNEVEGSLNFGPAGFYKDGFGIVHLVGVLDGCPNAQSAFTLPPGFRPVDPNLMVVAATATTTGEVRVRPNGQVDVFGTVEPRLYGVTFRASQ